ncbi:MAG: hypothetical protein IJ655_09690 [Lachnospiraceae bacterium]|nr:hypothetical protein [Lachnospiraceae bacterium]
MKKISKICAIIIVISIALIAIFTANTQISKRNLARNLAEIKTGDIICLGKSTSKDNFDGRWVVLDSTHTNTGDEGIFLASVNAVGNFDGTTILFKDIGDITVSFEDRGQSYAETHPGTTDYQTSDIKTYCDTFLKNNFTKSEQNALIATYKSDNAISIQGPTLSEGKAPSVDFDEAKDVLNGDKIFLLSAEEMSNSDYGFNTDEDRIATYKGEAKGYFLRSPHSPSFPLDVGFVFQNGKVMDYPVNGKSMFTMDTYARVACNLDINQIKSLDKSSDKDGKTVWNVSVK